MIANSATHEYLNQEPNPEAVSVVLWPLPWQRQDQSGGAVTTGHHGPLGVYVKNDGRTKDAIFPISQSHVIHHHNTHSATLALSAARGGFLLRILSTNPVSGTVIIALVINRKVCDLLALCIIGECYL